MNYIVVLVVILLLHLPSAVLGQLDEVCLTLPTDPNAHDDEQPRLVGVSLHLALDGLGQQNDEKLLSLQCPLNDDVNQEEVEVLKAENEALQADIVALQAELVALHGDAEALQADVVTLHVENRSLREELHDVLSGVLPINCISRTQCDLEKEQLRVQMEVIQAEYEADCEFAIQHLEENLVVTQAQLHACEAQLVETQTDLDTTQVNLVTTQTNLHYCEAQLEATIVALASCKETQAACPGRCNILFEDLPLICVPFIQAYEDCNGR